MAQKTWTQDEIKRLLETNDKMVWRSLVKLYEYQTRDEQEAGETHEHNGVGFNSRDSAFLSSVAQQVLRGRMMTAKQLAATRKSIMKYARQLTRIANAEAA